MVRAIEYSQSLKPPIDKAEIGAYLQQLKYLETALTKFIKDPSEIEPTLQAILDSWWYPTTKVKKRIDEFSR